MKKRLCSLIAVVLSAALLLGVMPLSAFGQESALNVTVASDIHYQSFVDTGALEDVEREDALMKGLQNPDMYYYASQQGQMNFESRAITKQMLAAFAASDDPYLFICGDLTCGGRQSHLEMAQLLKETEEESGKQIYVILGNHDCASASSDTKISMEEFKTIYADFGYNEAVTVDDASACYTADLPENFRLMAIDSCIYGKDDGEVNKDEITWIRAQIEAAEAEGKTLIAMMHHSLLPHYEVQPMIDDYENLANLLGDAGVTYVLTGHIHANDISSAVTKGGRTVYDIQTGSLITYPCPFRHITFSQNAINISTEYVTSIDESDLPTGYTDEQLNAIRADFPAFAKGFFEAGMCRWLNRYIGSAVKLGKTLKMDTESLAYKALNSLMLKIGDALALPIYDDGTTPGTADSIEEIAENAGYTLPKSDYSRVYQLVAAVMSGFFCGDEAPTVKTTEIPLAIACVRACLAHCIANMISGGKGTEGINALVKELTGASVTDRMVGSLANFNFADNAANLLVDAILEPLLAGLSCDLSDPADLNLTLPGYGETGAPANTLPLTWWQKVLRFLKAFFGSLLSSILHTNP